MQKFNFILIASYLVSLFLFSSCSNPKADPKPSDTFSAKVDGKSFTSANTEAVNSSGKITIKANPSSGTSVLTLVIMDNAAVGKYDINAFASNYYATFLDVHTIYESVSGSLEITKHNVSANRIEGKFSFKAQENANNKNITISEGSFSITYTNKEIFL